MFLIFKIIKLSTGALGKLQGGLDWAQNKARDAGPIKSFRDNTKKSRDFASQNRARVRASSSVGKNPYKWLQRTGARSTLGTLGASGGYASVARQEEAEGAMKNAKLAHQDAIKGMGFGDIKQLDQEILDANVGDEVRGMRVTSEMQRVALASAAGNKDVDTIKKFASRGEQQSRKTYDTFVGEDGGFAALDPIAPHLSRTESGKITKSSNAGDELTVSLKNFATLKGDLVGDDKYKLDSSGRKIVGADGNFVKNDYSAGQKSVVDKLATRSAEEQAIAINQFATRDDLHEMSADAIALMGTIGGNGEAAKVIASNGNLKLITDPHGNLKAVASDSTT